MWPITTATQYSTVTWTEQTMQHETRSADTQTFKGPWPRLNSLVQLK